MNGPISTTQQRFISGVVLHDEDGSLIHGSVPAPFPSFSASHLPKNWAGAAGNCSSVGGMKTKERMESVDITMAWKGQGVVHQLRFRQKKVALII